MSRTRAGLIAALVLSALALGGCSDDDPKPKFAPTPTESPTSASTSPTPAALDPEETVRAWVDAQNEALRTGDTSAMSALSAEGCRGCANFEDPIRQVYADGGEIDTAGWRVKGTRLRSSRSPAVVDTAVTISGGTTTQAGAKPVAFGQQKELLLFKLEPVGDGWAISFIGFVT